MKTSKEIEARIRSRLVDELARRLRASGSRIPTNCVHNHRHTLDSRKRTEGEGNPLYNRIETPNGQTIGLCMLGSDTPEEWSGNICEDIVDAQRCPYFNLAKSKEAVLKEFSDQIADITWLEKELPDVASLVWALERPVKLSLMARLKAWLFRVKVEPLTPVDSTRLLPSPNETLRS